MSEGSAIIHFIHNTHFEDLPEDVIAMAERCCLDLIGVAAAGRGTELSKIISDHVADFYPAGENVADILFTEQTASPIGAALAGGMTIDSFDAHDGHRITKGHAGAAVFPGLLAFTSCLENSGAGIKGKDLLTALVIGYEVSLRAGITLHATTPDYHTSGAWNAIGVAAMGARLLKLDEGQTRHALGIAEYHGPRSQMMRCIDHPTMVKDGSGWGAMTGVSAAYLAQSGFTGAPAISLEGEDAAEYWQSLGTDWEFLAQYFKPYPVCRWAQPAVQAVSDLMENRDLDHATIERIEIRTFHEALRLAGHNPTTTEEAQYAIAYPVAALITNGQLGMDEIATDSLNNSAIKTLSNKIKIIESEDYNTLFPAERWADVTIHLTSGETIKTPATCPIGDPENPLSDAQINKKFESLCGIALPGKAIEKLKSAVAALKHDENSLQELLKILRFSL